LNRAADSRSALKVGSEVIPPAVVRHVLSAVTAGRAIEPVAAPTFSFVIPAYNEADDIITTLECALAQRLRPLEIIVVDDGSTDGTLAKLQKLRDDGLIVVIEHGQNTGAAAARNAAIAAATGDVLVFVDADNWPPVDFLERLAPLYEQGFDFVSVESRVANQQNVIGRFQQAKHAHCYGGARRGRVGYTQAFSCRRTAAIAVGFPEQLPGFGGEDVEFFDRLLRSGYAWKGDFSIEVLNQVPDTLRDFWCQYRGRGKAVPYIEYRLKGWPLPLVTARRTLAAVKSMAVAVAVVPHAQTAVRMSKHSARGWRDVPAFWMLQNMLYAAHRAGEWQSLRRLWREKRGATP
jgi:glycosyltransferase involved in cell wall biosynthesis